MVQKPATYRSGAGSLYTPLHSLQSPEAIFTNSSRTKFAKCSQTYSYLLGTVGGGRARIPPAAPTPLTLPYTSLYTCTVPELCSRTVGEYRLRWISPALQFYKVVLLSFLPRCVYLYSGGPSCLACWWFFLQRNVYCL